MIVRALLLVVIGSFMWAARSFMPDVHGGLGAGPGLTLAIGFVLLASFFAGQLVSSFGLPKLTGYIGAGMLFGPAALDLVTHDMVQGLQLVNGVAISLIALTAGGELNVRRMRPLVRTIGWITLVAVIGTAVLLSGVVLALAPLLPFLEGLGWTGTLAVALVLGVTLSAQSPAVVIAVRAETNADGPVTQTILGVVVVADLVIIVLFAIASAAARAVLQGTADIGETAGSVAWELFGSIGAGIVIGAVLLLFLSKVRGSASLFLVMVCVIVAEVGTAVHLDPLIIALTAGIVVENLSDKGHVLLEEIGAASLPLYVVFFAVAGASIHLDVLPVVGIPAGLLVLSRAAGFLGGTRVAAKLAGAPPEIGKFAGFGLLPQAGLAIALSLLFARLFPELGADAAALTLGVVALNEILAPVFFRRALVRSGETRPDAAPEDAAAPEAAAAPDHR
ncbi:MAG: cation:proton antiporter [Sandaracinaceae bacterium]|nr:cation:proton antiporter [Sandaracinaceae bacterium]